jgi:hypothetical protein
VSYQVDKDGQIIAEILGVPGDTSRGIIDVPIPPGMIQPRWREDAWHETATTAQIDLDRQARCERMLERLDREAELLRVALAPPAKVALYFEKARQAREALADNAEAPMLDAEAEALGIERSQLAGVILDKHATWLKQLATLEAARIAAKQQLRRATEPHEVYEAALRRLHGEVDPPTPQPESSPAPGKPRERKRTR